MQGRTYARAPGLTGSPSSDAEIRSASSTASANGAPPSSVGSIPRRRWCITGLPTTVTSSTSVRSTSASRQSSAVSFARQPRTARVSSFTEPGLSITYETRLIRSSPKRICGFISPAEPTTSPVRRSQRWPATVVEPTSNAIPYAVSWKPGHTAVTTDASCTATVTCQGSSDTVLALPGPLVLRACWSSRNTCRSIWRSCRFHSRSRASSTRAASLRVEPSCGSSTSTV